MISETFGKKRWRKQYKKMITERGRERKTNEDKTVARDGRNQTL